MKRPLLLVSFLVFGCGNDGDAQSGSGGGGGTSGNGGSGVTGGTAPGKGISPVPGDPGCGFDSAAFCDTFDEAEPSRGRAGDLDETKWSLSRGSPQLPTGNGVVFAASPATIPTCRSGLPEKVYPDDDSLICDANEKVHSKHLLVAVGEQNYGQNSYRVRQPFDFGARTGTIVFDGESFSNALLGWTSVAITEDPAPIPSYSIGSEGQTNDEGGAAPRSGVIVQFIGCSVPAQGIALRMIDVFHDYRDEIHMNDGGPCLPAQEGNLAHFEITVSQEKIEVFASPFSEDGLTFPPVELLGSADVNLPFNRGYVQLTVHNHATIKYSEEIYSRLLDAWFTRFDNFGFDGPVVENWREYELPDSLVPGMNAQSIMGPVMSVGYAVPDEGTGSTPPLEFHDVNLDNVSSARLALASWYLKFDDSPLDTYSLRFRFNGGEWRDRMLTAGEIALLTGGHSQGALSQVMDVPLSDLVAGTNTVEFATANVPQGYPPGISSIDLVLTTD